jgi:hypothetical protein
MSNICKSKSPHNVGRMRNESFVLLMGALLAGCGGGGSSDSPPPASPAPPPAAPAPPPPAPTVPPLSSTIIEISDGHTVGTAHWDAGDTATGGQGGTIAGMDCIINPPDTYHVHSHVSVFLDGTQLAVPQYVGGVEQSGTHCFYPLHTHDQSGKIHVEAPAPGTFTLGQLFTIWGQPLESTNVAGLTGKPIRVFVTDAGVVTESTSDWANIELTTHREITFQVGSDIAEIPNYSWTGD